MRVLLIESETEDALFLRDVLTEIGEGRYWNNWVNIEVLHARSWKEASAILSNEPVDIALLDLDLADSQGMATFRHAQTAAPDIPMILLVGAQDESLGLRLVRDGAQDFLVKRQVDCAPLAHAMRNAIERHRALAASRAASTHDTLTGLLNRAGFVTSADHDRKLAERLGRRLMVMVAEPKNLGEIATAYGEQRRDLALVEAADHLRSPRRPRRPGRAHRVHALRPGYFRYRLRIARSRLVAHPRRIAGTSYSVRRRDLLRRSSRHARLSVGTSQ